MLRAVGAQRRAAVAARSQKRGLRWPVALFLLGLLVPWEIGIDPLRLSVYRIVLLVILLPCIFAWLSGKAGRKKSLICSFCFSPAGAF